MNLNITKLSLRNRLVGANLLIFTTVFLAVMIVFSFSIKRQKQAVESTLAIHLNGVADKITESFYTNYHQVQAFTKNPVFTGEDKGAQTFALNEYLSLFPENEFLAVVSTEGAIIASSTVDNQLNELDTNPISRLDFSKSKWLKDFQEGKTLEDLEKKIYGSHMLQPAASQAISKILKKDWYGTVFISPIDDGFGSALGYLVSFRNANWLERNLNDLRQKLASSGMPSAQMALMSSEGQAYIQSSGTPESPESQEAPQPKLTSKVNVLGPRFVDAIGWQLSVSVLRSEAFYEVILFEQIIFTVLGVLALLSTLLTFGIASRMYHRLTDVVESLGQISNKKIGFIDELQTSADQLSHNSNTLLQEMQSAGQGLSKILSNAGSSAENAQRTVESSQASSDFSESGKIRIAEVVNSFDEISDSSNAVIDKMKSVNTQLSSIFELVSSVGERTALINDIVMQTKVLSFNASVEAMRAGEAGKGFSVVAQEVSNLAASSGTAAEEIREILDKSQHNIQQMIRDNKQDIERVISSTSSALEGGQQRTHECKNVLDRIYEQASNVNSLAHGIQAEVSQQKDEIKTVEESINILDSSSIDIKNAATNTMEIAQSINEQSNKLDSALIKLSLEIHGRVKKDQAAA